MTASTLDIALRALKAHPHWYLFPLAPRAKAPPCFKNELELASNKPEQIKAWAAKWPGANWGLSLKKSRLVVIDVDTKPGKVGAVTLLDLELKHGPLPATYAVQTPSGGLHLYFDEANGVRHAHRLGVHGFGRDVDSTNYVVIAGCTLEGGGRYTKHHGGPIAPAPAWFAEYLRQSNRPADADQEPAVELDTPGQIEHAINYLRQHAPPAIEGRNGEYTLLTVAARLKDLGISEGQSVELLADYYNPRCEPPWSIGDGETADRLDVKVHNAWLYLKGTRPGAHTPAAEFAEPEPAEWVASAMHPSAVEPQRQWNERRGHVVVEGVPVRVHREYRR